MADEHCAVCADKLTFTAFGPCGHKEACSKCLARLRFVMGDKRCVICQQEHAAVFVTRFMGDYTRRVLPEEFNDLKAKSGSRELYYLKPVDAYFDDKQHFNEIRALCSYTHPLLEHQAAENGGSKPQFRCLKDLRKHLQTTEGKQFCDVCLEGRKVFISEQVVYDKAELARHNTQGDVEGPLAESGFKGHPSCKFCRKRFYGDQEIYAHMQTSHEQCFLCRRERPDKYVYYRDYKELEEHFQHEHWLCPHQSCREQHFVVFNTEGELRQHQAREHGENMSKQEKRSALTLRLDFQYRGGRGQGAGGSGSGGGAEPETAEFDARRFQQRAPAFTIGGGAGLPPRRNRSAAALNQAVQASMETAVAESARRSTGNGAQVAPGAGAAAPAAPAEDGPRSAPPTGGFRQEDFPAPEGRGAGPSGGASGSAARWAAAAGAPSGSGLRTEDFPSLPGTSKAAKRRAKAKEKSFADRVGPAAGGGRGGVRVINAGGGGRRGPAPTLDDFPGPPGASQPPAAAAPQRQAAPPPPPQAPAAPSAHSPPLPPQSAPAPVTAAAVAAGRASPAPRPAGISTSGESSFPSVSAAAAGSGHRQSSAPAGPGRGAAASSSGNGNSGGGAGGVGVGGPPRVSKSLVACNKALVSKIKRQVSADEFDAFRQESSLFMTGDMPPELYFELVVGHGLAALVPDLAALCPEQGPRVALLQEYRETFVMGTKQAPGSAWIPPEAATAAAEAAERFASWHCGGCGLTNSPEDTKCENCGRALPPPPPPSAAGLQQQRQQQQQPKPRPAAAAAPRAGGSAPASAAAAVMRGVPSSSSSAAAAAAVGPADGPAFPALPPGPSRPAPAAPAAAPAAAANGSAPGKKGKKGIKMALSELPDSVPRGWGNSSSSSSSQPGGQQRVKPGNIWTQSHPLRGGAAGPSSSSGGGNQWAKGGGGKLATELSAINQAWSKK